MLFGSFARAAALFIPYILLLLLRCHVVHRSKADSRLHNKNLKKWILEAAAARIGCRPNEKEEEEEDLILLAERNWVHSSLIRSLVWKVKD